MIPVHISPEAQKKCAEAIRAYLDSKSPIADLFKPKANK